MTEESGIESILRRIKEIEYSLDRFNNDFSRMVFDEVREVLRSLIFEEWKRQHIENVIANEFKDKMDIIVYEASHNINQRVSKAVEGIKEDIKDDLVKEAVEETLRIICRKLED